MSMPQRIVVPTDFSKLADEALQEAVRLASRSGARLYIIHVIRPATAAVSRGVVPSQLAVNRALQSAADEAFVAMRSQLAGCEYETVVLWGSEAEIIVRYASKVNADLIVISTHGRRGVLRFLLGSTTQAVVRDAPCPVLIFRGGSAGSPRLSNGNTECVYGEEHCACRSETVDFRTIAWARGTAVRVRDAMRRRVVGIEVGESVAEAVELLAAHDLSEVPVISAEGRLLGILELQALANLYGGWDEGRGPLRELKIGDLMRSPREGDTLGETDDLTTAIDAFARGHAVCIAVVKKDRVIGQLFRTDLVRVLRNYEFRRGVEPTESVRLDDHVLSALARAAIECDSSVTVENVRAVARSGVVHLYGGAPSMADVHRAGRIVERLPGVVEVDNCIVFEPALSLS